MPVGENRADVITEGELKTTRARRGFIYVLSFFFFYTF